MSLVPSCPRCPAPVAGGEDGWHCPDHGGVAPLWRPESAATYELLAQHLELSRRFPTLLPWPLSPGWSVTDFGCVAQPGREGRASFCSSAGPSDPDGMVELTVVSEEPGVGLGARCAGTTRTDPGGEVGLGAPHARVRLEGHPIALWSVSTSESSGTFDRWVLAGEAQGRWLWIVLRPASAALLLSDERILLDLNDLGPELVELPFGPNPPPW